jgi:hypothetical protein
MIICLAFYYRVRVRVSLFPELELLPDELLLGAELLGVEVLLGAELPDELGLLTSELLGLLSR